MANGHGGVRDGAGRKRKPAFVDDGELSPLQYLLGLMRNKNTPRRIKIEAAKAALPFCSARLQNTILEVDADLNISLVSYLDIDPDPEP